MLLGFAFFFVWTTGTVVMPYITRFGRMTDKNTGGNHGWAR